MNMEIQNGSSNHGINRLERLAKYLMKETEGEISYKLESNSFKINIKNAMVISEHGIIHIVGKHIILKVHLWLKEKRGEIAIGIQTERRIIGIFYKGNIQVRTDGNDVVVTLEPQTKVEVYAS